MFNVQNQTIFFKQKPHIIGNYAIVGPKEGLGSLKNYFDYIMKDDLYGEKTYEKAERKMVEQAVIGAVTKANLTPKDLQLFVSGDLLNQIVTSSFAARAFDVPYVGLFGACSTMAESLAIGASLVNAGYFDNVACATASHFSTAERQFRYPLELGNQRPPTSQWTVTGAGCSILSSKGNGPIITSATFGKVTDFGINDVNNMGSVMAPGCASTMISHFKDTNTKPDDYDLIVTGDLGKLGSEILIDLLEDHGYKLGTNYNDCGQIIFNGKQSVLMGGSGCGCSASVLNSYILEKVRKKEYNKVLFVATGALLSSTSTQQGDTIPGIAHAVVIESYEEEKSPKKEKKGSKN
ncbi:MAG: stage V sporulation protein AD [Clostridiales bacterium]|nr:stage V sporulation protein AD [Clostridiales bacterium]